MPKRIIATESAPKALGPYSQGNVVECKKLVFTAGQVAIDPAIGKISASGIAEQTHQVLKNLKAILEAAGSGLDMVLKTTVYLKNLDDFKAMNEVYQQYFTTDCPARSAAEVARLPLDALVEIEAIGYVE
jgi:2-iminobutanoate/2-iminopropanoate deaminase